MAGIQSLADKYIRELRKGQESGDFTSLLSLFTDDVAVVTSPNGITDEGRAQGKEHALACLESIPSKNLSIFPESLNLDWITLRLKVRNPSGTGGVDGLQPYEARMMLYASPDKQKFSELQLIESPSYTYRGG